MTSVIELIKAHAPQELTKPVKVTLGDGKTQRFVIKCFHSVGDYERLASKCENRKLSMKAKSGKLAIIVPADMLAGLEKFFPDATKPDKDGKVEFYLTSEQEVTAATYLETCVVEPQIGWAEAATFVRVFAVAAIQIVKAADEFSGTGALEAAKND